jgi:hypothetical protein
MSNGPDPGWYPDPNDRSNLDDRYWNGTEWTDLTRMSEGGRTELGPPTEPVAVAGPPAAYPAAQPAAPGQVLVSIGEINCTATTVMTPNGSFPIRGTEWIIHDATSMTRRIPAYAIVLAIVFSCLLIGLLFLLIQEDVYSGSVNVTVRDRAGNYFATSVPVRSATVVGDVHARVNYCRYLSSL